MNNANSQNGDTSKKKFLGVHFKCCNVYLRIYINRDGTAFAGRCPRCGKPVNFPVGEGGTSNRFFEAR